MDKSCRTWARGPLILIKDKKFFCHFGLMGNLGTFFQKGPKTREKHSLILSLGTSAHSPSKGWYSDF